MDRDTLRNNLFEKYFENKDGILAIDLVNKLSFIPDLWKKLHKLCEENVEYFDSFDSLEMIRVEEINCKKYLILKLRMARYVIIDLEKMENITEKDFTRDFNEEFFIDNFNEVLINNGKISFARWYRIENFKNPEILVDFYNCNEDILTLPLGLYYRIGDNDAWTYFYIDFVNSSAQLGFQTPDQFLYEQLFMKYDLTASSMQDAISKIGLKKMHEMFERIKEIKIPKDSIPNDLLEQFFIENNTKKLKLQITTSPAPD